MNSNDVEQKNTKSKSTDGSVLSLKIRFPMMKLLHWPFRKTIPRLHTP